MCTVYTVHCKVRASIAKWEAKGKYFCKFIRPKMVRIHSKKQQSCLFFECFCCIQLCLYAKEWNKHPSTSKIRMRYNNGSGKKIRGKMNKIRRKAFSLLINIYNSYLFQWIWINVFCAFFQTFFHIFPLQ